MKKTMILSVVFACLVLLLRGFSIADTVAPVELGTVKEQHSEIPPAETSLSAVWKDLEADEAVKKEGALLWLLRRNRAEDLGYFAFPGKSIRFGVDRVRTIEVGGVTWRLAECRYQSRTAESHGGMEWRAIWQVAYLFDDLGHLRDWVDDYDVLYLDDLNQDGAVELFAYIDSPKRALMYSYERGRSREVLRVDGVPEGDGAISLGPLKVGVARRVAVAGHGDYAWDKASQRYVSSSVAGEGKK